MKVNNYGLKKKKNRFVNKKNRFVNADVQFKPHLKVKIFKNFVGDARMLDSRALYTRHLLTKYTCTHLTSRHLHALGLDFISLYSLYPFAAYDTHTPTYFTHATHRFTQVGTKGY